MPIAIDGLLNLYQGDVFVREEALSATPERLFEAVKLAYSLMSDEFYGEFVNRNVYLGAFWNVLRSRSRSTFR